MLHVVLAGVGEDSVEIVKQALDEYKEQIIVDGIVFDEEDLDIDTDVFGNYPMKQLEDLPNMVFDKLLVCANENIANDTAKIFRENLELSEEKCGVYARYKIGAHKVNWDTIYTLSDLRQQIIASGTMNDLEVFFYCKEHRVLTKWLHYFEVYDRHFSKYRNQAPVVMEIGVFKGGSLQMWKDYFGEGARIIGVDIDETTKDFEEEQISIEIGSQEDRDFLKRLKEKYPRVDILIDDGGHTMSQQITTFEEMFPHISYGGTYLCEDLHSSYMKRFGGGYRNPDSYIEYSKNFIDYIHAWLSEGEQLQPNQYSRTMHSLHYYDSALVIEKEKIGAPLTMKI